MHLQSVAQERSSLRQARTGEGPAWAAQPCQMACLEERLLNYSDVC